MIEYYNIVNEYYNTYQLCQWIYWIIATIITLFTMAIYNLWNSKSVKETTTESTNIMLNYIPESFEYVGTIGNILYYKTTINNLLEVLDEEDTIKIWAFNRNIDQEWIDTIRENFETEKVTGSFKLCKADDSEYFYLIDGQHRVRAYADIEENFEVCIEIYICDTKEKIQSTFLNVNCSKPLLDDDKANLAITNSIIQKLEEIYCVTADTQKDGCKSGSIIWTGVKPRYPKIWVSDLKPKLQRLVRESERINSEQIVELIQKVNMEYRLLTIKNIPNVQIEKFRTKGKKGYCQAKNIVRATHCYLGIDKEMGWVDRVKELYYEIYIE